MQKSRKIIYPILITLWCTGLCFGMFLSAHNPLLADDLMRAALTKRPSFLALLLINVLPVVILYVILLRSAFPAAYPLVFLIALGRGFCAMCAICFLGSGAWLLRMLFLFSAGCVSVLIWYLLFSYIQQERRRLISVLPVLVTALILATIFDYFRISPYLLNLSMYF